jgi:hypothetical protein
VHVEGVDHNPAERADAQPAGCRGEPGRGRVAERAAVGLRQIVDAVGERRARNVCGAVIVEAGAQAPPDGVARLGTNQVRGRVQYP